MQRMKWVEKGYERYDSADGRFDIGRLFCNEATRHFNGNYLCLRDNATGKEYPCRTVASAKAAARNILIREGAKTCSQ